jgi:hypothetical protein
MSHTPTPWEVCTSNSHTRITEKYGVDGGVVSATIASDRMAILRIKQEDAEFIVRACNAHDELVAALRGLKNVIEIAASAKNGGQFTYLETRSGHFVKATDVLVAAYKALAAAGAV